MFWITIKRVCKSGWINFKRNGLVSSASVLVTTITLTTITALFLFNASLSSMILSLQDKVDISVYFTVDAPEERILALRDTLTNVPEVRDVQYVSADEEALAFRDRHAEDYLTLQALDELGGNRYSRSMTNPLDTTQFSIFLFHKFHVEPTTIIGRDNQDTTVFVLSVLHKLIESRHQCVPKEWRAVPPT
jgi:hypothetical protein